MNQTRSKFLRSTLMLFLCFSMFVGSTFAWFTDSVSSRNNVITAGNLDLEMYFTDKLDGENTVWTNVETTDEGVFVSDNWEPGYTEVKYLKIVNKGNLAFQYKINLLSLGEVGLLAEAIDVYSTQLEAGTTVSPYDNRAKIEGMVNYGTLDKAILENTSLSEGVLLSKKANDPLYNCGETIVAIALQMQTNAGNKYQDQTIGDGFSIQAIATQFNYEEDGFGSDYDSEAFFPSSNLPVNITKNIEGLVSDGKLTEEVTINAPYGISVTIPSGVKVDNELTLSLSITDKKVSDANVKVNKDEELKAYDVHVEGIAEDNTVPMIVNMGKVLPTGLNKGNLSLYHVEDNTTKVMSEVNTLNELTLHNQFVYEPSTGELVLSMATFSEVAIVAEESTWEGNFDYTWYDADKVELTIANADQLAALGKIVGGMAEGLERDSFDKQTIKLLSDINLGDAEKTNNSNIIFYPIGYYNSTGSYEKTSGGSVTSTVKSFEGTFDGNGHTISNFYQNTWEMFGDYNSGYSGTPNHYKDAMGLFGYVVNGTVKNLTVNNFSSDGEYTPTGVIAAYAVNSTFENIAITNCNPRVYNTGNGGIVGIGGNDNDPDTYNLTFNNITIDNSNKITALWGSWDVACGGLVGMFRGAGHVNMNNCHVAAQMDVYNDVCGNYQYYWYRYSGMMVGTNKNMITDKDGYTVPETSKYHAEGCTVHFGEWNNYYYCELVANSLASYTHDHQFSRLTEIKSLDEIKSGDTWTKTGNFLLISGDSKTCYHIVKNTDGTLKQHLHTDAGEEVVNGQTVLKENNQIIYLPFNQLFTGYGWGVKHIPVYNGENYAFEGITILDREEAKSVQKFNTKGNNEFETETAIQIGNIFTAVPGFEEDIKDKNVKVTVSPHIEGDKVTEVTGTYKESSTENWEDGTLIFNGTGKAVVTISDYYFCTPTSIVVTVKEKSDKAKFEVAFDHDADTEGKQNNLDKYTYRVGNMNSIKLSSLFSELESAEVDNSTVTVTSEVIRGNGLQFEYVQNKSNWKDGTIKFNGTGIVKLTIKDEKYCTPTQLELEVVNALNTTSATSAKANNVVLLNNVSLGTIEVSGGYTLYGNGFKMTAEKDIMYDTMGVGFVTLKNGTLDNVQVICPNFSYSVLYTSDIKAAGNTAKPSDYATNDARGNVRSAVMVDGNSKIINSYVHGGRAAVFLRSGNLTIDGSTVSGGATANIHALVAQSLTLRNVQLIQKVFKANVHDTNKEIIGFSGLFENNENGDTVSLILEGKLIQNAWANEEYKEYIETSYASSIINKILREAKNYLHDLDGDSTNESLNLGFAYYPSDGKGVANPVILDNRIDKDVIPYEKVKLTMLNTTAVVYSYVNSNGTTDDYTSENVYSPTIQGNTPASLEYTDESESRKFETSFNASNNRWESSLTVDLDEGDYEFSFDKLLAKKYGENLDYTVELEDGTNINKDEKIILKESSVTMYIIKISEANKTRSGANIDTLYFKLTATKTSIPEPTFTNTTGGTPLLVVKSKNSDWSCAVPALEGFSIKYYTKSGEKVDLDLSSLTPTSTGKQNETNNYWEISKDDYKLKITSGYIHEGKQVYGMPVVVNNNGNKMYFTISSTTGYVSTGTAARAVTLTYEFTDPNGKSVSTAKTYNVKYADYKDVAQYSYNDFVKGTLTDLLTSSSGGSGGSCVTPDTLITLADGTQKRVDSLTGNEELLVWNLETGKYDKAPIVFIDTEVETEYEIVHLYFNDGSDVKVIDEHGFFDLDLGKYVYIDANNYNDYIGHKFVSQKDIENNTWNEITLDRVVIEKEVTTAWSPVTYSHLCYYTNGVLSMPGGIDGLFNIYKVNTNTMKYNPFLRFFDRIRYGVFTYADFEGLIPEEAFYAFNGEDLKVAMGKGLITWEDIEALAKRYVPLMK